MPARRTRVAAVLLLSLGLLACGASAMAEAPARADVTEVPLLPPPRQPMDAEARASCGSHTIEARVTGKRVVGVSSVVHLPREHRRDATPAADAGAAYQPLRIRVFTGDIDDSTRHCTAVGQTRPNFEGGTVTCTAADVLTAAKKRVLKELLVPSAIQLHEERLMVQPVSGNIVVDPSITSDALCGQFSIPAAHTTTGVSDADFILYLSAGPLPGGHRAWAATCQRFSNDRPSVGIANVSPKHIAADPHIMRTIAHELLHALGFTIDTFSKHRMVGRRSLRGKGPVPVITSAHVVAKAKAQYGCTTQTFMELEDQGGEGTALSHWKRRSAKDELMAGTSGVGYYTALTIAAMEDMGFYKGNYAKAEPMAYGQNAGCALATSKCISSGASKFPDLFCASTSSDLTCTSDHRALGACNLRTHSTALPSAYRYFASSKRGGGNALMDYCPYQKKSAETSCISGAGPLHGSTNGVSARCFNSLGAFTYNGRTKATQKALCADIQCGTSTYAVKVAGATSYATCKPGSTIALAKLSRKFSRGSITCPAYNAVCIGVVDASLYAQY